MPRALAGASGLYHAPYPVMAYRSGIPSIVTVHDVIPLGAAGGMPLHARLLFRTLLGLALRASRCVITVSASTRRDLLARSRIEPARVFTIPLAAAPQFRPASQAECARVRSRYRLPARYVLYVGINKPHKNLTRLIEAWRLALPTAATRRECPLVIAGPRDPRYPDAREISERLNVSPSVRYLGPVGDADLAPLYSGAGLFVLPSLCEGFGLPILEAMECGAPVACADRDGPPEVAGGAAALFDPTNVPAMARVIADVLGSPALAARLRERGFARSRTFSWERTAAATLALYRELSS